MSESEGIDDTIENSSMTKKFNSKFKFPPPPKVSFSDESSGSSDVELDVLPETPNRSKLSHRHYQSSQSSTDLPPIGFFWDIENCQVPKKCSAIAVVAAIRNTFLVGRREVEFVVVCDTRKEQPTLLQELNDAQINLLHVCGTQKNAADEKLRQCMRRYAELHANVVLTPRKSQTRPAILLISGDINFAADLSDFRYRKKMEVILVHMTNTSPALMSCATQHHCFTNLTTRLPRVNIKQTDSTSTDSHNVDVSGLPVTNWTWSTLARRLKQLASNLGGKVISINPPNAVVRFQTVHQTLRAIKRMNGEDVFGQKIRVVPSIKSVRSSSDEGYQTGNGRSTSAPIAPIHPMPPMPTFTPQTQNSNKPLSNRSWNAGHLVNFRSEDNIDNKSIQRPTPRTPLGYRSIRGTHGNRKSFNGYPDQSSIHQISPSPSPVPSISPAASVTPSPSPSPTMLDANNWNVSEHSTSEHSDARSGSPPTGPMYVDITVTNLEHSADPLEVRNMLHRIFSEHVPVLDVSIRGAAETLWARVRVCGTGAAQLAVARLHRRRVAGRRLLLSLAPPPAPTSLPLLRLQVASLLQTAPDQQLPLFRLRELYATKHGRALPAAEVARLRDTCQLVDSPRGRSVKLIKPPPVHPYPTQPQFQNQEWWNDSDVCKIHGGPNTEEGDEVVIGGAGLLPVYIELPLLSHRLNLMLNEHGGGLLLHCFPHCYQAQFGESLIVDPNRGVPLEHLIACIRNVLLRSLSPPRARKIIIGSPSTCNTDGSSEEEVPSSLLSLRTLLARELHDLLRTVPRCQMPFSRLIPSYHLHFGRQCRVADYGFTRLADLLDSLNHTVQVMGEGSTRVITLSHSAQMKRFTADLLKVLRAQPDKSLILQNLPDLYQRCLGREFEAVEYGACRLEDLINNVPRYCVAFGPEEGRINLPRHRQTPDEVARMRHFASQAAELLRHAPNCRLELSRFVPAYHTHFGRQLRVAHYGLPKVQDLFHAIPDTVEMWVNEEGERVVALRADAARRVLGTQLAALPLPLSLASLPHTYKSVYGHALLPSAYGCSDLITLLRIVPDIQVIEGRGEGGALVVHNPNWMGEPKQSKFERDQQSMDLNTVKILPKDEQSKSWVSSALFAYSALASDRCVSNGGSQLLQFQKDFNDSAGYDPPLKLLEQKNCIKLSNGCVLLSPLWRCIGRLVSLQKESALLPIELANLYQQHFIQQLPYQELGFSTVKSLIDFFYEIWEKTPNGHIRVRPEFSNLISADNNSQLELLPSTPPGQKSGVWSTPPAVPCGPWKMSPAPPAPSMLPLPAPQLLGPTKRRVRLAAQFDSPT
ncbi:meiosis regulator and mRNA stability factor 1-like protein isoform X2 [Arctopsyche grandis]|uniref:meiosis regulator and mRNA stability factor 1-like protein isoform X2 n=1 Tax=Arctopsyche grandis TaxID=121162 RepID=UPI00406D821F